MSHRLHSRISTAIFGRLSAENERLISGIEAKLDTVCAELRAIRCEIKIQRSDADLDRWFWILMLISVVLNLTLRAMLNS